MSSEISTSNQIELITTILNIVDPIAIGEFSNPRFSSFGEALHRRPDTETNYIVSGVSHLSTLPQSVGFHSPPNPFGPLEQMFKLANMIMYKNEATPIHSQGTAQLTLVPGNGGSGDIATEDIDTVDYLYNSLDNPSESHAVLPSGSDNERAVYYGPPFIFKQPVSATNTKKVINLIENAIDSVYNSNGGLSRLADDIGTDAEIEVHCPIHHGKKSIDNKNGPTINALADDSKGDGVIQVCSCRLIKKKRA